MPEVFLLALRPAIGWAIAFAILALVAAVLAWALRRARRGPRAQQRAAAKLRLAGEQLVALDDAVAELDLSADPASAPADTAIATRRARMSAQHARDDLFGEYRAASAEGVHPTERSHAADRITARARMVLERIARTQAEHAEAAQSVPAVRRLAAVRSRYDDLRARMGDPTALVRDLQDRFNPAEGLDAAACATAAVRAADLAGEILADAGARGRGDGAGGAELRAAERAVQRADENFRVVDESYRLTLQASAAVGAEITAAQALVEQAITLRERLDDVSQARALEQIQRARREIADIAADGPHAPTSAVVRLGHLHERLDLVLDPSRTDQQRTRAARLALAVTLAAARVQLTRAEAQALHSGADATARAAIWATGQQLGTARVADDPRGALDAARRALHTAEESVLAVSPTVSS